MAAESTNLALNPGEVVSAWREYKNEPAFYIGIRRPEFPENPASFSIVINWRLRMVRGVATAVDETDSYAYAGLQLITAEGPLAPIQTHAYGPQRQTYNAGQRAALTDEDKRQGRGVGLTDAEKADLVKRGGVPPKDRPPPK